MKNIIKITTKIINHLCHLYHLNCIVIQQFKNDIDAIK